MNKDTRDVFILAGAIAIYGVFLLLAERAEFSAWGERFSRDPRAIFGREHDRDRLIAAELNAEPFAFTPPADTIPVDGGGDTDGTD